MHSFTVIIVIVRVIVAVAVTVTVVLMLMVIWDCCFWSLDGRDGHGTRDTEVKITRTVNKVRMEMTSRA